MNQPVDPSAPNDDTPPISNNESDSKFNDGSEDWISDDLIPDVLESTTKELSPTIKTGPKTNSDALNPPIKKHSAELFPIPPADSAPLASSLGTTTDSPPESIRAQDTAGGSLNLEQPAVGPLPLVETAFLASAASLMWLVNTYFPPGPFLRILFPLPIALVYLRWNMRAAWMAATVAGLLLTILLGPTRSVFFIMPYGFLGVQLGFLWRRQANWGISILTGGLLVALGSFFRIWLLSLLAGEDLWGYSIAQITQLLNWLIRLLTNWGWIGLGALGRPGLGVVSVAAIAMIVFASIVYLFTVHLAAWLVLERLGISMPEPPGWVQALIEE